MRRTLAWITLSWLVGVGIGCNQKKDTTAPPGGPPPMMGGPPAPPQPIPETAPFAAGKKVYNVNGCARCHSMGGPGGGPPTAGGPPPGGKGGPMMKNRGPDLAKVGGKPDHTVEWLSEHVRNPKAHKEDSRMPPYDAGKIKDEDLKALAEFLASLK